MHADHNGGLSDAQLQTLRERLEQQRAALEANRQRAEEVARQTDQLVDPMDNAELTREQDDGALFVERDRARLREIDAALARMETGRYGVSEASGKPIAYDRLLALPWARHEVNEVNED